MGYIGSQKCVPKRHMICLCSIPFAVIISAVALWFCCLNTGMYLTPAQEFVYPNATNFSETYENMTMEAPCATNLTKILKEYGRRIDLSNQNISCIAIDTFVKKEELRALFLGDNPVNIPPDRPWIRHPSLTFLDISDCNLGQLSPVVFEDLPSLKTVDMAGNYGCTETQKRVLNIKINCGPNV